MRTNLLFHLAVATLGLSTVSISNAQAPAKADAGEVTTLTQTMEVLPREVLLALHGAKKDAAVLQATDALRKGIEGKQATLKFKMERIEKDQARDETVDRYRVKAEDTKLTKGATNFVAHLWVHFDASESAKVSLLKKGAQVTATGKITLASVSLGNPLDLHIDISQAKLDDSK
jgi:hypothetical protein